MDINLDSTKVNLIVLHLDKLFFYRCWFFLWIIVGKINYIKSKLSLMVLNWLQHCHQGCFGYEIDKKKGLIFFLFDSSWLLWPLGEIPN